MVLFGEVQTPIFWVLFEKGFNFSVFGVVGLKSDHLGGFLVQTDIFGAFAVRKVQILMLCGFVVQTSISYTFTVKNGSNSNISWAFDSNKYF